MVGSSRPDIAHAVANVLKLNSEPTEAHLTAVKRIFRYLKGTINLSLCYSYTGNNMFGYSDVDWADDRHSTSGNVFIMAGGAVSWLSQKQQTVHGFVNFRSRIIGSSVQEAIWLQRLLTDFKINTAKPTNILEDNQSAIAMCNKNPVGHKRAIRTLILNTTLPEKHCKLEPFL